MKFSEIDIGVISRVIAAGVLLPSSAKVMNEWSYIYALPYVLMT